MRLSKMILAFVLLFVGLVTETAAADRGRGGYRARTHSHRTYHRPVRVRRVRSHNYIRAPRVVFVAPAPVVFVRQAPQYVYEAPAEQVAQPSNSPLTPEQYAPVCGADGMTYFNKYVALKWTASVQHDGECSVDEAQAGYYSLRSTKSIRWMFAQGAKRTYGTTGVCFSDADCLDTETCQSVPDEADQYCKHSKNQNE